jgi:hypothetical protein
MRRILPFLLLAAMACNDTEKPGDGHDHDHDHDHDHESELMNEVVLTFTPQAGGDDIVVTWVDGEDNDTPIVLADADDYDLSVGFFNTLEDPAEDITLEIADEADEHQLFFTGSAVAGPASTSMDAIVTHSYVDTDDNGLPLGLENTITTDAVGSGDFIVTLRHMPAESGNAVKVDALAEDVAESGFGAIGGNNDVQITLTLEVQ